MTSVSHPLLFAPPDVSGYDESKGTESHEQVRSLLTGWGAESVDAFIRVNFANYRYFAVSSLGATPDIETNSVDPRGVQPFRVDEPLTWLLSRLQIVGTTRR